MEIAVTLSDPGPSAMPPPFAPQGTVQLDRCGANEWTCLGEDPQFLYRLEPPLPAGWYRLRATLRATQGRVLDPCVYVDQGQGFAEDLRMPLRYDPKAGLLDAIVRFDREVRGLRFDPSTTVCCFVFDGLCCDRLGEAEAAWLMARALMRNGARDVTRLGEGLRTSRRDGDSAAALELVWSEYRGDTAAQDDAAYLDWIRTQECPAVVRSPASAAAAAAGEPMFSVVLLPEGDSSTRDACLEALLAQSYPYFEILVPKGMARLGGPGGPSVREFDDGDAGFCPGAKAARGRYLTWIAGGERMPAHALAWVAQALEARPGAVLLYTDEDFLAAGDIRRWPYFKPAWDPDLQAQHDYVGPSSFLSREWLARWIHAAPPSRAWRYAAIMAAGAEAGPDGVLHLPVVARHHLDPPGEPAAPLDAFAALDDMGDALTAYLARTAPEVEALAPGVGRPARVRHPLPSGVRCDIVIPTRDRVDLLSVCVDSILTLTEGVDYRITIVDNGSAEPATHAYFARLQDDARVRVLAYDAPFNYSAINNFAVRECDGDIVVLLNNDIEVVDADWLRELASQACRPGIGAVGARLLYPDRTLQHAGVILGVKGVAAHPYTRRGRMHPGQFGRALAVQSMSAVTAACLAVRRRTFDEVGGLDESLAVAFNDVDFCLRLVRAGHRNLWTPYAELIHHESASRGYEDDPVKQARFASEVETMQRRWGLALERDPAYSPNLSLSGRAFTIDPLREADFTPRTAALPLLSLKEES
ncbi:glycosyltransferase family 2 protein [Coralloluteibacterium thermophilus]|uniref:Glycosyltransferase family 2 protein n=1 Tax=Coralloluteibacterium thermophilum TaxID=2707049 RepID=A0ABV9NJE3_9GAMM